MIDALHHRRQIPAARLLLIAPPLCRGPERRWPKRLGLADAGELPWLHRKGLDFAGKRDSPYVFSAGLVTLVFARPS